MNNEMTVKVTVKYTYGEARFYPDNKDAFVFARLTNTKTLTKDALGHIRSLGYKVEVNHPEYEFS